MIWRHTMVGNDMRLYNLIISIIFSTLLTSKLVTSQLENGIYKKDFPEEQEPNTVVVNLASVFNVRASELAGRRFEILGQRMVAGHKVIKNDGDWLKIDPQTGVISVKTPVDRETECGDDAEVQCVIKLQAAMLPQAHFRLQAIELRVTDVNDHAPKFPETGIDRIFSLNVSEDAPEHTKISLDKFLATDEDLHENAMIYYSVSRNDHFALNQYKDDTGASHLELVIISSLDYEDTTTFDLTLTAKDRGSPGARSSQVFLRVNVIDANDNYPVFDESEYKLELRENLPTDHVITTVVAHDADTGRYGKVKYFIPRSGNSVTARKLITVDTNTGAVKLLKPLDRETRQNLRVVIAARDQGDGVGKIGKTILMIQIMDVNDNAPRIHVDVILKGQNKAAYVPEDSTLGTYVAHVTATDADSGESGRVTLSITTQLDYSNSAGMGSLSTIDSNKGSRRTAQQYVEDFFILKSDNLIATNAKLDRETNDRYIIKITACDNENPKKCSEKNVSVVVLDANDHWPKFKTSQKAFTLSEDTEIGSYITTATAFDEDSLKTPAITKTKNGKFINSRNGEVVYSLTGGGAVFAIESKTGKLTLVGKLDYEMKKNWKLTVTASDLGETPHKTNFTLEVRVKDVNDNKPEFINPGVTNMTVYATILEDRPIIRIKSIDRDSDINAKVWYAISSEDGANKPYKFIIDPVTGSLRLNASNKLTDILGEHWITIKARDQGRPPQESETRLIIKVTDLPLASIIPNYQDDGEESSKITVIVLASLASATVLLLLILACIVIKCRKENKEIRTYSCRAAESKSGRAFACPSKSSMSQIGSIDEVVIVSTPGVTTTKDADFGRAMEMNRSRSMTRTSTKPTTALSNSASAATTERGPSFTTFSLQRKNDANRAANAVITSHTDRDSGKGESDKDSDSYGGEKDLPGSKPPSESNLSQSCSGYLNELGPRCTISCRKYGHSDECWMPVVAHCEIHGEHDSFVYSDAGSEISESNRNYPEYFVPSTNTLPGRYGNFDNCGLETISETQPLRIVLDTGDQTSMYSVDSYSQQEYPTYPGSGNPYQSPNHIGYSPSYYTNQTHHPQIPGQPDWRDMYRSQQTTISQHQPLLNQSQNIIPPGHVYMPQSNGHSSQRSNGSTASVLSSPYVPYEMPEMYRAAPIRPRSVCENNGDVSTGGVMEKVKRFSQAPVRRNSLRDQVLHTRFLNNSMSEDVQDSRAEESLLRSSNKYNNTHAGESSNCDFTLEETKKIISDVDNLISS